MILIQILVKQKTLWEIDRAKVTNKTPKKEINKSHQRQDMFREL